MQENKKGAQKSLWVLFAFVLLLYLIHFAFHAQKNPLRLDEVDYYQCMENIVQLGLPWLWCTNLDI
ncbi:MAG: hypothetical protein RML46_05280 [Anaerolineae bacterium]|nr:hypothetical protein [Anaerolineae bacterium]